MNSIFYLNGSVYDQNYSNSFTPVGGEGITCVSWNPGNQTLFEESNGFTYVYTGVQ